MNFREKNPIYQAMKGPQYLEADKALLASKEPKHKLLTRKAFDKAKLQGEILYYLLDIVEKDEIRLNRRKFASIDELKAEFNSKLVELKAVDNEEAAKPIVNSLESIVERMPEELHEEYLTMILEAMPTTDDLTQNPEYLDKVEELKKINFIDAEVKVLDAFIKFFKIETENNKKVSKIKALENFRATFIQGTEETAHNGIGEGVQAAGSNMPPVSTDKKKE